MSRNWDELIIWQESHKLVLDIYQLTSKFPKEEIFNALKERLSKLSLQLNNFIKYLQQTNK